jgi:uncharacterized protein YabN with tetrapyrrole methylase and pyrophosphatase domain
LRRECPWDREQDARSIVPHTLEEAYELADAIALADDRRVLDELGDLLFQVHFLSLLAEERGAGDLAAVAEHCREKLIRRHPHVFGEVEVRDAGEVLANWDAIKRAEPGREPGVFGEVPEILPAPLYARKLQRRAASAGRLEEGSLEAALAALRERCAAVGGGAEASGGSEASSGSDASGGSDSPGAPSDRDQDFAAVGELLFAAVDVARRLRVDPELALRAASQRFADRVEAEPGEQRDHAR